MNLRRTGVALAATLLALLSLLALKGGGKARSLAAADVVDAGGARPSTTVTGPAIALAHGLVQVRVTLSGGRITDVTALQLPHDNSHSWDDSNHAVPILRSEVLSKQSADIDVVSGATYTSRGYARSLQAALDAAGKAYTAPAAK